MLALAVTLSSALATAIGFLLPYPHHRRGKDPAFGSGPLTTVVQDLLSIALYLSIARAIL